METKSLVKCILFLEHTSRFVSHFLRMSHAISSVCWIRRRKDTDDVYVSFSRRKGFCRDRFSLQYFLSPSFSFPLSFYPPPLSLAFSLSLSLSLSLSHNSLFVFLPSFFIVSVYLFLSAGNGIATALPVVPKASKMSATREFFFKGARICCYSATDRGKDMKKEG